MKIRIAFLAPVCLSVCAFGQLLPPAAPNPGAGANNAAAANVPADQAVLSVGGFAITRAQFDQLMATVPEQQRTANTKQQILESITSMLQIGDDARAAQFDKKPDQALQLKLQNEQALAKAYLVDQMNKLGDDAFLKDWYSKNQSQFSQWKARHILIRTQGSVVPVRKGLKDLTDAEALAKAKAIKTRLAGGADFATVAKADSDDVGTAANGGDLGFFGPGEMVAPVEAAITKMKVNEISEPVKTEFGYHVVQLLEVRSKPFEEAKDDIRQKASGDLQRQIVDAIRKKHPATVNRDYFGQ